MKKFLKACLGLILVCCATLTFVGCSVGEVEENTKTAIEATTSIIPVEYSQKTAQGILMTAYQKLLSSEKVNIKGNISSIKNGIHSNDSTFEQTVVYRNNSRYFYVFDGTAKYVVGKYNGHDYCLDVNKKEATMFTSSGSIPSGAESDILATFGYMFGFVTSGRYFDGVTYINLDCTSVEWTGGYIEIKIVDGNIVEMSTTDTEDELHYGLYTFSYDNAVNVSVIPETLNGYTKK